MICVSKKNNYQVYGSNIAAETAAPVMVCSPAFKIRMDDGTYTERVMPAGTETEKTARAEALAEMEKDYFFAGVARSKSVRTASDGNGPDVDEYFTISLGGMVSLLNNSNDKISSGDDIMWSFAPPPTKATNNSYHRLPNRITVKKVEPGAEVTPVQRSRIIGRALSFANKGEPFDLLLKQ